jgi:hypothetical protein
MAFLWNLSLYSYYNYFIQVFVLPPMHRPRPFWYNDNYTFVAQTFARVFSHGSDRLTMLPSFECPPSRWESDGTHLTPGEGER